MYVAEHRDIRYCDLYLYRGSIGGNASDIRRVLVDISEPYDRIFAYISETVGFPCPKRRYYTVSFAFGVIIYHGQGAAVSRLFCLY